MPSSPSAFADDVGDIARVWRVPVPALTVSAGAGGAMLTITLLQPAELTLHGGHALVLHDPVGLTGERLLAHLYRFLGGSVGGSADPAAAGLVRWIVVRPPLHRVWEAVESLHARAWRPRPSHPSGRAEFPPPHARPARVAEPAPVPLDQPAARPHDIGPPSAEARLLFLSESDRIDALSPLAGARLVARALRREWGLFAVTREGPAPMPRALVTREGLVPIPRGAADGPRGREAQPWRTHLVCQRGVLRAVDPLAG